jgi:hypothetical protein
LGASADILEFARQYRKQFTMSRFVRHSGVAIVFAASLIGSPGFAQDQSPDLAAFFTGNLVAKGQFSERLGATRGMQVNIRGTNDGHVLKLVEDVTYTDGETRKLVWRFSKDADGRYVGHRADLIGDAKIVTHGDAIEITYSAHIPMKDGTTKDLNFAETFTFTQPGAADYRVNISLLFIPVADAHLTVRKLASSAESGSKRARQE